MTSSQPAEKSTRRRLFTLVMLLVLLGFVGFVALDRRNILDWWKLRHYKAPSVVAQLAGQDTMTPYARRVFYVNAPAIESKTAFNANCPHNGGEQTIVLGCYHSDQSGIFLLTVSDPRLNGVEQVTAAHETLHAIYDRLSSSERSKVDDMLLNYYHHNLRDPRILSTIAAYQKTEPNDWINEMHSVFGTEISQLPPSLEAYYKQYFTNRQQITAYAAQYESEFTSRQAIVKQDDAQLASWLNQINADEASLQTEHTQIDARRTALVGLQANGDTAAYNAGVPAYNDLISTYNSGVSQLQALIAEYNQLVASRNAVAFDINQLSSELNANAVTPIKNN